MSSFSNLNLIGTKLTTLGVAGVAGASSVLTGLTATVIALAVKKDEKSQVIKLIEEELKQANKIIQELETAQKIEQELTNARVTIGALRWICSTYDIPECVDEDELE